MPTVYVIQNDNKDLSDAKRYGELEAVFFNPRKPYDTNFLLDMAHKVLSKITKYDYILMVGDPPCVAWQRLLHANTVMK